jgi:4-hydroxy-tetrahydrodipicolinate synthase
MIKSSPRLSGALAPVLTPFNRDGSPSAKRFIAHARHLLNQDVGLALFGTNSEFASLTLGERRTLFDALLTAIAPTNKMMVGVGACAHGDVVEMTKAALEGGCPNVLMLPPFYFKGVSEEGIFRSVSNVIESVGDSNLRIYLYHIPSVTQVPFNMTVIERLLDSYPGIIAGIKDTSGDISHSLQLIERF